MPKHGAKERKKPSLFQLMRKDNRGPGVRDCHEALTTANDRTAAIAGSAAVDQDLIELLLDRFIALDDAAIAETFYESNAVLGTFADRIAVAYLLGIIPVAVKQDLDHIRRIRSVFAHRFGETEFSHPLISDVCEKLQFGATDLPKDAPARFRYVACILALHTTLVGFQAAHMRAK